MATKSKPSFLRLFLGGFALGAAAMAGVAVAQADHVAIVPAVQAATR